MGTTEFNSACFYRYSNVDLDQLRTNLGDEDLATKTLEAFIRASVTAIPTGKQNSMAAQNPPSFVLAVARRAGLWSLANAFVKPVRATRDGDLVKDSINALDQHWGDLIKMYGDEQVVEKCYVMAGSDGLKNLNGSRAANVSDLVDRMLTAAQSAPKGE